ncbi:HAAS signaling domain-containing protein [Solirubrobacter soli]|uniref:HAAS signaling domain-containing protein n=1 Tax=Solirubrobacter soli TaxID=363832 RepID=UPI0012FB0986|nr:hypothetical protein [Solirubrobacter soli]
MSDIDRYIAEVADQLCVRGTRRRRILSECRDHLLDAAADRGDADAVRAFGPARELAAAFDVENAARRGVRSTMLAVAGVAGIGVSTLALIQGADDAAPVFWAIVFFSAAQLAGTAATLALVQALVLRRASMSPAELALLARRNMTALIAGAVTMVAAVSAVRGGAAFALLAGSTAAAAALIIVIRVGLATRRLEGARDTVAHSPLADLAQLAAVDVRALEGWGLLAPVTCLAAAAAYLRDVAEHATVGQATLSAGIEAAAVIVCFAAFGPALGLWTRPGIRQGAKPVPSRVDPK